MEACKVRIQTQPGCSSKLAVVLPKILKEEGVGGLYKGNFDYFFNYFHLLMIK